MATPTAIDQLFRTVPRAHRCSERWHGPAGNELPCHEGPAASPRPGFCCVLPAGKSWGKSRLSAVQVSEALRQPLVGHGICLTLRPAFHYGHRSPEGKAASETALGSRGAHGNSTSDCRPVVCVPFIDTPTGGRTCRKQ